MSELRKWRTPEQGDYMTLEYDENEYETWIVHVVKTWKEISFLIQEKGSYLAWDCLDIGREEAEDDARLVELAKELVGNDFIESEYENNINILRLSEMGIYLYVPGKGLVGEKARSDLRASFYYLTDEKIYNSGSTKYGGTLFGKALDTLVSFQDLDSFGDECMSFQKYGNEVFGFVYEYDYEEDGMVNPFNTYMFQENLSFIKNASSHTVKIQAIKKDANIKDAYYSLDAKILYDKYTSSGGYLDIIELKPGEITILYNARADKDKVRELFNACVPGYKQRDYQNDNNLFFDADGDRP